MAKAMKSKALSKITPFRGGVPKELRKQKGAPGERVIAQRSERGKGIKFKCETYTTVSNFKPGTKIKFGPNPKTPGSKSFTRYAGYQSAKTVGEALKQGSKLADLCWELERGQYTVIGGVRSDAAEKAAIGDSWFQKATA